MEKLATMLKNKRRELNLTQDDIAEKIYVSRQTVSSWERGNSVPSLETLVLLSDTYDIDFNRLLKNEEGIVEKFKKQNVKKFKMGIQLLFALILLLLSMHFTNNFAKDMTILTIKNQSYLVKRSFFGKGDTLYFYNSHGKYLYSRKMYGASEIIATEEEAKIMGLR